MRWAYARCVLASELRPLQPCQQAQATFSAVAISTPPNQGVNAVSLPYPHPSQHRFMRPHLSRPHHRVGRQLSQVSLQLSAAQLHKVALAQLLVQRVLVGPAAGCVCVGGVGAVWMAWVVWMFA